MMMMIRMILQQWLVADSLRKGRSGKKDFFFVLCIQLALLLLLPFYNIIILSPFRSLFSSLPQHHNHMMICVCGGQLAKIEMVRKEMGIAILLTITSFFMEAVLVFYIILLRFHYTAIQEFCT